MGENMVMDGPNAAAVVPAQDAAVAALTEARTRTLALVASISDSDLERVYSKLMSPLAWDLGHIAAFEDLWISHRYGGLSLLREGLADIYDAFETPRAGRGDLPFLRPPEARVYLRETRARALQAIAARGGGHEAVCDLVVRHEQQHNETMLQTLGLARLDGVTLGDGERPAAGSPPAVAYTGLELVAVPGGECTLGAPDEGFAYDNERPRHRAGVPGFQIGITPVTNGAFRSFIEAGGYERPEWWSAAGWAWRTEYEISRPQGWTADLADEWRLSGAEPLYRDRPVIHLSWFEADAFARAHGARLPTEAEWEKAATWDPGLGRARANPWGEEPAVPGVHGNLDQLGGGTAIAGAYPAGAAPSGCLGMIGDVWEWTASDFAGYPGFSAYPYREYSEVFFGPDYKVLRGGSWATRPAVATSTFRNWDLPQRRQIFAGVRIARDL